MQRRSSGSSEDSADASVRASRPTEHSKANNRPNAQRRVNSPLRPNGERHSTTKSSPARSRRPSSNINWQISNNPDSSGGSEYTNNQPSTMKRSGDINPKGEKFGVTNFQARQPKPGNPWAISLLTLFTSACGIAVLLLILFSSAKLHCDSKGCRMSWMSPSFVSFTEFDTEHTRLASKYSLHLYREQTIDNGPKIKGIPVLFIPGNAGSYKQVRSIASESSRYFHEFLQHDAAALGAGVKNLDFFAVDFNEDFSAFDGQTMLDQAEYVNEAIRFILSLYLDPRMAERNPNLPDPSSVVILGHSMGGVVARASFIMPNYQPSSINTIITMSAPHARAPVTFDPLLVKVYEDVNEHWRLAYSKNPAGENPLDQVTLVSIAGGGLDTVVPSDYASLESLVPDTHGFTVFTSTIPNVWVSMDHQAITWCDQFRKVMVRSLYDVVDNREKSQTKPRPQRMQSFKKRFLTGMEAIVEKAVLQTQPNTLLILEDDMTGTNGQGDRLVIRKLGLRKRPSAHLLPVPHSENSTGKKFTLLSDSALQPSGGDGKLEVLFCNVLPLESGQANMLFPINMDLTGDDSGSTRFACTNAASDVIPLPASTQSTRHPFFLEKEQQIPPFSYLQYGADDISEYEFVAIVDKSAVPTPGWVIAEFSDAAEAQMTKHISISRLASFGLEFHLPSSRPMVSEVRIPSIQSSLLAYNLELGEQSCRESKQLFLPLVRQYLSQPYESKYFVNARNVEISLHGVSPFVPPPLKARQNDDGMTLQFWIDPTCDSSISIKLTVDPMGSFGKLYMRYRTVFASFPLLIVAIVLRKQFQVYDNTGTFIPFSESLDSCLRRPLPLLLLSMTLLSLSMGQSGLSDYKGIWPWLNGTIGSSDAQNDLLVGTTDPFFWFLIPMIGVVCLGVCVIVHYMTLALISGFSIAYALLCSRTTLRHDDKKRPSSPRRLPLPVFAASSPRKRFLTTTVLLFLVSTLIPYQFAYVVACLVQLGTSVRAHRLVQETPSITSTNFNNYVHTIFLLMLWILPINLPTLVVWVRNLAVQWFTPFSSHHNMLSILPFVLLVETLTMGKMISPITGRLQYIMNVMLFGVATYAAIYGVSYAYMLHRLINIVALWLVAVHSTSSSWTLAGIRSMFDDETAPDMKRSKKP